MLPGPVVYQHIPKTGGVSVRSVAARNFHVREIAFVADDCWRDKQVAERLIYRHRFIHGHLHYEFVAGFLDSIRLITVLRNPIERVISLYWFLRRQDTMAAPGRDSTAVEFARTRTLLEFASCDDPLMADQISNAQLRMLLDHHQQQEPSERWGQMALDNLRNYAFVGVTELLSESMQLMSQRFGWIVDAAPVVNRSPRQTDERELSRVREVIARRNGPEIELYTQVAGRLRGLIAEKDTLRTASDGAAAAARRAYTTGLVSPISMDQPLRCWGWHDRETNESGATWRCAENLVAGFELKLEPSADYLLVIEIPSVSKRIALIDTIITVNGRLAPIYPIERKPGFWLIFLTIDQDLIRDDGIAQIEISCSQAASAGIDAAEALPDDRHVTFALGGIEIAPIRI
jgi:CBS domain-containing protein